MEGSLDQVLNLKLISKVYECFFRLKVNIAKSSLVGIGIDDMVLSSYVDNFGCRVESWPLKYLGMLLGGNPRAACFWDPVLERVQKKLICWKKSYVFLGERITLIKAAMSNVPVYYMSLF